ncbi:transglycosylase family protein [Streptomyces termitum]|uniref:transglycosylase family protein n=1 Tax=Streptomyces termitum TaxID=67368 RepID=UPI0033AB026F
MLSGNGRHRRPRQAPALVVTAGVTGSALALPLLATGSASAADAATWDRVAACESGGQWSANFGNDAYGGLQFTQEAWERHGGLAYAPSPDLASRAQQITIADRALAAGSADWATCAPIAGLKNDGKPTGVQPGPAVQEEDEGGVAPESNRTGGSSAGTPAAGRVPDAEGQQGGKPGQAAQEERKTGTTTSPAAPTTPAAPGTPDASVTPTAPEGQDGSATPSPTDTPTAPGTTTPGAAGPDASPDPLAPTAPGTDASGAPDAASEESGKGRHRGEAAQEESGVTDTSQDSGKHAASEGEVGSTPTKGDTSGAYTVRPGDSLSGIAQENDLPGGWDALYDANRQTVGIDPDLILPGQSLDLTLLPSQK